jgi:small-conductance mechanosensitive channel
MLFAHFIFAVIVALVLSLIVVRGLQKGRPWPGFLLAVLFIFLAAWAGGIWISPFGPALWEQAVLPFVVAGLVAALIIAAVPIAGREETGVELTREEREKHERTPSPMATIGVFFWILIVVLALAILLGYIYGPDPGV